MRHRCNLCSLQFETDRILEKHSTSFHISPGASIVQPILPVVLEKIKVEPELIKLEEDEDGDQTPSTILKQPPKAILEKSAIIQIVKRLNRKDCYQCEVCLEKFSLLRYFRKHLATTGEQGFSKCQEFYKFNIHKGSLPTYIKSYTEEITPAKHCQTTQKEHSQSRINSDQTDSVTGNVEVEIPLLKTTGTLPESQIASCKQCYLNCDSYEQLCVHYSRHHNLPMVYLTQVDNHELYEKYKRNVESMSKSKIFKCDTCPRIFSSRYYLQKHVKSKRCANGDFSKDSLKPSELDGSIKEVDKPKLGIDLCKKNTVESSKKRSNHYDLRIKRFSKLSLLRKQNSSTSSQFCYKCPICKRKFSSPTMLRKHKLAVHKDKHINRNNVQQRQLQPISTSEIKNGKEQVNHRYDHECNVCQQEFSTKLQLTKHMLNDHQQKPLECDVCQKKYSSTGSLNIHKRSAHEGFRHKCDACLKDFSTKQCLQQHKRAEHDGLPHQCELCLTTFTELGNLRRHKISAHDCVRYKCKLCPQTFTRMSSLKHHKLAVHDGVRHKCKLCPKTFTELSNLKRHKIVAHDCVRYKCKLCPATFAYRQSLREHKRAVHDGFRNTCDICQNNFCNSGYLNLHKLRVHHV